MADDFQGSIAQLFINYSTNFVLSTVPGQNYYQVMLFCGHTEAAAYLVDAVPAVGGSVSVSSATLSTLCKGALLGYLTEFFASNTTSTVLVVIYDDALVTTGTFVAGAVTALTTQYTAYKTQAYFKMMTLHDNIPANSALATLCAADVMLSKCWIDANDAQMLVPSSVTSMYGVCHAEASKPVIIYHPDVTKSPCLAQLGLSLSVINASGTPVGNSLDYLASSEITPSGTAGASLSSANMATLQAIYCGYYLFVGDGSGRTAVYGGKDITGALAAAIWITQYIDYVSAVQTAVFITSGNNFKNSDTYACILQILRRNINLFVPMGRLSDVVISAPAYKDLPPAVGDMIVIPNAWSATYNDNLRKVQIQGTLYISAS